MKLSNSRNQYPANKATDQANKAAAETITNRSNRFNH